MKNYIFITGGVMSSLGKGMTASVLGFLLKSHGYKVIIRKFDPYLNIDSGTMSPHQHGEVFVTEDGSETDLDLGHYERFLDQNCTSSDAITIGKAYYDVLLRERRGSYLGSTVQVIPHITDRIKELIVQHVSDDIDFLICELGGTVGDIEGVPLINAVRQLTSSIPKNNSIHIHLTYLPYLSSAQELKTKPSQHAVKELMSFGIHPDILLCRCDCEIPLSIYKKLSLFCNLKLENIIGALDVSSIYEIPLKYMSSKLDMRVLEHFQMKSCENLDMFNLRCFLEKEKNSLYEVTIAIVIKYTHFRDAYKSILESFTHAAVFNYTKVNIKWIDSEVLETDLGAEDFSLFNLGKIKKYFNGVNGIIIPGGYGLRGARGKMIAASYARINNIPFFGICFGMQLAVIEFARNVAGLSDASSSEFGMTICPVVSLMTRWGNKKTSQEIGSGGNLGGTMRVGSYHCNLIAGSLAHSIYGSLKVSERHRHRYELNILYRDKLEKHGLVFSGMSPDNLLPEIVELKDHAWYVATQFHPEFKSRPFKPHPIFNSFLRASLKNTRERGVT